MISLLRAKSIARRLLRENRHGRSWRQIAREDYCNRVNYATLNRFANGKGEWIPKDENILLALGLIKPRSPFAILPKWFDRSEDALAWFKGKREKVKEMHQDTREAMMKAHVESKR